MKTPSLRTRLILGIALAMAVLLGTSGVGLYALLRRAMFTTVDESLASTARLLVPVVEYDSGAIEFDDRKLPDREHAKGQHLLEIWLDDHTVVHRSSALGSHDLPCFGAPEKSPEVRQFLLHNGEPARAVGIVFVVESTTPQTYPARTVTLVVARSIVELEHHLTKTRRVLFASFAAILLASSLIVVIAVSRGLRPVHTLAAQIENVSDNNLSLRVDASQLSVELLPIADRLNQLLARLETAFERERGFTADVAHELRTPLAGIRTAADVALATPQDSAEYTRVMRQVRAIGLTMETMVERLLMLARLDNGQIELTPGSVEVRSAIDSAWAVFESRAKARAISFENRIAADLRGLIDPALFAMILGNVLGNAVDYANEGGHVLVDAARVGRNIELSVSNTGCEVRPDEAEKCFQRFWRGDLSRTDTGIHCGLGLALVKRAIDTSRGHVSIFVTDDKVFVLRMTLPQCAELPPPN